MSRYSEPIEPELARVDWDQRVVRCCRVPCPEILARIVGVFDPEKLEIFSNVLLELTGPQRADIRFTEEMRRGADSVWRITRFAQVRRRLAPTGQALGHRALERNSARPNSRRDVIFRDVIRGYREGPNKTAMERLFAPIPAVVECPQCGHLSRVNASMLVSPTVGDVER